MRLEAVIFDFGRTLYDPPTQALFPETNTTLEALRERALRLGMVTVAETDDIKLRENEIVNLGLKDYFDSIDIVTRSGGAKDFTKVIADLNLADYPDRCAIVGDNLKVDIAAAKKIGAYTIWTRQRLSGVWTPQDESQIPHETIDNLSELVSLIDSINN